MRFLPLVFVLALSVMLTVATGVRAAEIFVQWDGSNGGGVIRDPSYATTSVGGSFIEADMGSGAFAGSAFSNGTAQSAISTVAYSGIIDLIFTNTNPFPVTIGDLFHPFDVEIDATFAHSVDPTGVGSWTTQLIAILIVDVQGDPSRIAQVGYSAAENWNNGLQASVLDISPSEQGGASVSVTTGTVGALRVGLETGTITLDPGETMAVHLNLQPIAIAIGSGFTATTDMATTPTQIRLDLPAGVTLLDDAAVPLTWVPEPGSGCMLATGVLALAIGQARRRERPRTSSGRGAGRTPRG